MVHSQPSSLPLRFPLDRQATFGALCHFQPSVASARRTVSWPFCTSVVFFCYLVNTAQEWQAVISPLLSLVADPTGDHFVWNCSESCCLSQPMTFYDDNLIIACNLWETMSQSLPGLQIREKKGNKHNAIFWLQIIEFKSAIFFLCVTYRIYSCWA